MRCGSTYKDDRTGAFRTPVILSRVDGEGPPADAAASQQHRLLPRSRTQWTDQLPAIVVSSPYQPFFSVCCRSAVRYTRHCSV